MSARFFHTEGRHIDGLYYRTLFSYYANGRIVQIHCVVPVYLKRCLTR
jgi:hypothetical protein